MTKHRKLPGMPPTKEGRLPAHQREVDVESLPASIQQALKDFEQDNNPLPDRRLVTVLDAYLAWEGVHGYAAKILAIFEATEPPLK